MPSGISDKFFKMLLEGLNYYEEDGVFYTDCTTRPADLEIMLEGCAEYSQSGEKQNCDDPDEYKKNSRYYWVKFAGQDMIIDTRIEEIGE